MEELGTRLAHTVVVRMIAKVGNEVASSRRSGRVAATVVLCGLLGLLAGSIALEFWVTPIGVLAVGLTALLAWRTGPRLVSAGAYVAGFGASWSAWLTPIVLGKCCYSPETSWVDAVGTALAVGGVTLTVVAISRRSRDLRHVRGAGPLRPGPE